MSHEQPKPPRELSKVLSDLIGVANEIVTRHGLTLGGNLVSDKFSVIAAEVRAADARPAEGIRRTNAAIALVTVIEAYRASNRSVPSPWLMAAGPLLEILREEAFGALNDEKEARAN